MKKYIISLLIALPLLYSCGNSNEDLILGTWVYSSINDDLAISSQITFSEDNYYSTAGTMKKNGGRSYCDFIAFGQYYITEKEISFILNDIEFTNTNNRRLRNYLAENWEIMGVLTDTDKILSISSSILKTENMESYEVITYVKIDPEKSNPYGEGAPDSNGEL